ncbi:MAG: homoserine kinase [Verrucomicrobiales bacterium]|jgi:homoserine kinase
MRYGRRVAPETNQTASNFPEFARVRVPGSTSNIGPGYDCLGIALAIYNEVVVRRGGEGAAMGGAPEHPMVTQCASAFFEKTGKRAFAFRWEIEGDVPISRGLGSSVTLRLGILQALNELAGRPLDELCLFRLCTEIEGHPDNAGPAVFGGFVITNAHEDFFRFEVDAALRFVLLVPDLEVLTENARTVLPQSILHKEAVKNMSNACSITAAFATREYGKLRDTFDDFLHQTYRQHLVPGLFNVILAGTEAGALGGFLSGSGSTIACLTNADKPEKIARAMQDAYTAGHATTTHIIPADNRGSVTL